MENEKIINCWFACFDLLAFRDKFNNLKNPNSLKAEVDIYFKEILEEAKEGVQQHKELLKDIEYGFYSDYLLSVFRGIHGSLVIGLERLIIFSSLKSGIPRFYQSCRVFCPGSCGIR